MKALQHYRVQNCWGARGGESHHCRAALLLIIIISIAAAAVLQICPGLALPLAPQRPRLHVNSTSNWLTRRLGIEQPLRA